jgi:hypothetical protein
MSQLSVRIKKELDRLKAKSPNRLLEPSVVVAAAKSPKSPLHGCFEWRTQHAAQKYLLHQARQLLAAYTVVVTTTSGEPIKVRHFVSLTSDRVNGGGYRSLPDVMNDEELSDQMLADALSELQLFQIKYSRLKQLQPIFDEIDNLRQTRRIPPKKGRGGEKRAH